MSDTQGTHECECVRTCVSTLFMALPLCSLLPGPGLGSATWLAAPWPQVRATSVSRGTQCMAFGSLGWKLALLLAPGSCQQVATCAGPNL